MSAVFPELAAQMDSGLRDVMLEQLLSHTSGIPSNNDTLGKLLAESFTKDGLNLDELSYWWCGEWSRQKPAAKPGDLCVFKHGLHNGRGSRAGFPECPRDPLQMQVRPPAAWSCVTPCFRYTQNSCP